MLNRAGISVEFTSCDVDASFFSVGCPLSDGASLTLSVDRAPFTARFDSMDRSVCDTRRRLPAVRS